MKLIKPTFEILPQSKGLDGIYKQIEIAGRHCYKSEDKITETSAKEFVDRMIKSNHVAMLEHGTTYLKVNTEDINKGDCEIDLFTDNNPYSRLIIQSDYWYITTNLRVLLEHNLLGLLKYIYEPTEFHEKRTTVKFIMDRIGSQSFVRHRVFSFAQESTRYCNYSKDKFDNEITIIAPNWLDFGLLKILNPFDILDQTDHSTAEEVYLHAMAQAEQDYFKLLAKGWTPQQARAVLPNSLKTELVMTGFDSDWEHFFELRTPATAHPQARELAIPLQKEMNKIK